MCIYGRMIKNPKYRSSKKNGGQVPAVTDIRVTMVPIACGQCIECRKKKAREWQIRLTEDIKTNKNGHFVTLTLSDKSIKELNETEEIKNLKGYEKDNAIATLATRRFLERWRKKHKKSVRHWLITELGHNGTENIHLHGIIWTDKKEEITEQWKYGYTWIGDYVSDRTVNYIIKYVTKKDKQHEYYESKMLTTAGIGREYINTINAKGNQYKNENTREYYTTRSGHKISLPVYWRNKIYTEVQREKLWIEKLNKEERYVMGVKIDVSQGEEIYNAVLEEAQKKNIRLGYGSNKRDWNKERYERERRDILNAKRINNAEATLGYTQVGRPEEGLTSRIAPATQEESPLGEGWKYGYGNG